MIGSLFVAGLFYYPVKSLAGIPLREAELTERGIANDRLWMLVRDNGRFITQREEHRLALLAVRSVGDAFSISAPSGRNTTLSTRPVSDRRMPVSVWKDALHAIVGPDEAADFFSEFLGYRCIPVFMGAVGDRNAREYAPPGTPLSFADAYPGLVTTEASLIDLNERTSIPIEMRRFRPNLVVVGCKAYDEDTWAAIEIGDVGIECVKPCARCVLTTVDPDSGASGKEPLRTLAAYRRRDSNVYFGQNFVVSKSGRIRLGESVAVTRRKDPLVFHRG